MFPSLYAVLFLTLVIDLHAKNQHNIYKLIEKVWRTVPCVKFTRSKAYFHEKMNEKQ